MIKNLDIDYEKFDAKKIGTEYTDEVYELQSIVIDNLNNKTNLVEVSKNRIFECLDYDDNECIGIFDKKTKKLVAYADILLSKYSNDSYYKNDVVKKFNKEKGLYFRSIIVHPGFRGNKFMQKIMNYFFDFAIENKKEFIVSTVDPTNSASMHSFKKLNFEVVDRYSFEHLNHNYNRCIMFKSLQKENLITLDK
jgi:ribosomal protein S18 acetylase RimI-like enzyme